MLSSLIYFSTVNFESFLQKKINSHIDQYICMIFIFETFAKIRNCFDLNLLIDFNPLNAKILLKIKYGFLIRITHASKITKARKFIFILKNDQLIRFELSIENASA